MISEIKKAHTLLSSFLEITPLKQSNINSKIYLKLETFHHTGSYKERGALYNLLKMNVSEVVLASAGNHSQAVAYHCKRLGIKCNVYMPKTTPINKIERTKSHDCNVILYGETFNEAYNKALTIKKPFIYPFDDINTIIGQGTIAHELFDQMINIECIIVPIGGGGLISGIAYYAKNINPNCKIYGVEAKNYPKTHNKINNTNFPCSSSFADAIVMKRIGYFNEYFIKNYVDDIILIEEEFIKSDIELLLNEDKILVEGAGVLAFSAVYHNLIPTKHDKIICICSGGNINFDIIF